MSMIATDHRTRSGGFARRRAAAVVWAIGCALQLEAQTMNHFWIDSPAGSVEGGEVVTIHVVKPNNVSVKEVRFGDADATFVAEADGRTLKATTPPCDREGRPVIAGVYERRIQVELDNGKTIDEGPSFLYLENTPSTASQVPALSLKPGHGLAAGGQLVAITSPALTADRDCQKVEVLFGNSPATVLQRVVSSGTLTVRTPPFNTQNVIEAVSVQLRCAGWTVGDGTFLYTSAPATSDTNVAPIVATAAVGLLLATQLLWILRRLENLLRRDDPPASAEPSDEANEDPVDTEMLTRFVDDHRRAIENLQRSLVDAVGSVPQQVARLVESREKAELQPEGSTRAPATSFAQTATSGRPVSKPRAKAEQPQKASAPTRPTEAPNTFSADRLAEMWNEVRRSAGSSEELIQSLNSAWPGKVVARASGGLIVVTSADEDSTWVLPSTQPLVHEATIQEFFEVRLPGDAPGPRLVRPANVPRGTDPHGFTAGQITRGVLEA